MEAVSSVIAISLRQGLAYGFLVLGVYLTFKVLDFPDLTVDGSFPLGGAIAATFIFRGGDPFLGTVLAVGGGVIAGLMTGVLHTRLKINKLLSGILAMVSLYSINLMIMGRANVSLLRTTTIYRTTFKFFNIQAGAIPVIVFLAIFTALILALLTWFLSTELGFAIRATGDNEQMIRGLGVNTNNTKLICLAISNGLVALSGALVAQDQGFSDIGMGVGMIIIGLASVIIGEVIFPARRMPLILLGIIGGSIIYRLLISTALRLGLAPTNLKLITAILVIIALSIPNIRKIFQRA